MDFDALIFIGPQGSGKGTQAKLFAEKLGFFYLGTGAILREIATHQDELGKRVKDTIDRGLLLDDETIFRVLEEKVDLLPRREGIIFDGFPRRVTQAEYLLRLLGADGKHQVATIFLGLPHEESVDRLVKRAEIEGRKDDTRERIELRLRQYEAETVPVLDYLKTKTAFFKIDGTPPPDEVTREIAHALGISGS